jgi:hypothetical protein
VSLILTTNADWSPARPPDPPRAHHRHRGAELPPQDQPTGQERRPVPPRNKPNNVIGAPPHGVGYGQHLPRCYSLIIGGPHWVLPQIW